MSHLFHVYSAALGLVSAWRLVLGQLKKLDRALADQLRRAARWKCAPQWTLPGPGE